MDRRVVLGRVPSTWSKNAGSWATFGERGKWDAADRI